MSSPDKYIPVVELADRTAEELLLSITSQLDEASTAVFNKRFIASYARVVGELSIAETATVEPVEPEPTLRVYERASDEELQARFEAYVDVVSDKRQNADYAKQTNPKFGSVRPVNIPRRSEVARLHKVPEASSEQAEAPNSDPITEMLEVYKALSIIGNAPIGPSEELAADEKFKQIILNPKVRARVASQVAHDEAKESGKGRTAGLVGRFVRVATDQIGFDAIEDSVIVDTIFRIESALETAKRIYVESGESFEDTVKSKEVNDLAGEYPAVRDMLRYWKRLSYGLPIKTSTINYDASGATTGGSWSEVVSENGVPIAPEDREWFNEMSEMDAALERVIEAKDLSGSNQVIIEVGK